MIVSTLATMSTFMLLHVPMEKAKTYTTKCLILFQSCGSITSRPSCLPTRTVVAVTANWQSVTNEGTPMWCTASLLMMSIPAEHSA